jgi:hypothetical protein
VLDIVMYEGETTGVAETKEGVCIIWSVDIISIC